MNEDEHSVSASLAGSGLGVSDPELPLRQACELFERQYVIRVIHRVHWNVSGAARVLRVHRNTLLRKLAAWGLERPAEYDKGTRPGRDLLAGPPLRPRK